MISSYLVANEETWKRGVTLSFASAVLQALVAVAIVGIAAALLGATAKTMNSAVWWIEIVSYALIALMGARLLWTKGRAFIGEWAFLRAPKTLGAAATVAHALEQRAPRHHEHGHDHSHAHHDHDHRIMVMTHHDHAHHASRPRRMPMPAHGEAGHVHDEHCGHSHGPTPDQLAGPGGWKRGLTAIFAVGPAALLGRDPGAGVRAGAGHLLGRRRGDLRDGARHRHHGRGDRDAHGLGDRPSRRGSPRRAPATARSRCAASRSGPRRVVLLFGVALLAGYMASERLLGAVRTLTTTRCCVVGGGPAGMMLGFLLARAGVDVVVLEKHADFLRDFRGDTVHPSTLEIMRELGLLDEFLKLPHQEVAHLSVPDRRRPHPGRGFQPRADALQVHRADAAVGFSQFPRRARQALSDLPPADAGRGDRA